MSYYVAYDAVSDKVKYNTILEGRSCMFHVPCCSTAKRVFKIADGIPPTETWSFAPAYAQNDFCISSQNETQQITCPGFTPDSGHYHIIVYYPSGSPASESTGEVNWNANAATIKAALEALSRINYMTVTCDDYLRSDSPVTISFDGDNWKGTDMPMMGIDTSALLDGIAVVNAVITEIYKGTSNPVLYTTGNAFSGDRNVYGLSLADGNVVSYGGFGGTCFGIVIDYLGNFLMCGSRNRYFGSYANVWKFDSSWNLLWSYDTVVRCFGIDVDIDGNIYLAHSNLAAPPNDNTCTKLDSDGNFVWATGAGYQGTNAFAVTVEKMSSDGYVYCAGQFTNTIAVYQKSDGAFVWGDAPDHIFMACVDYDYAGNVYCGGYKGKGMLGGEANIWKYDSAGTMLASYLTENSALYGDCTSIKVNKSTQLVFASTDRALAIDDGLFKFDEDLALVWSTDITPQENLGIILDNDNNIYTCV